MINIITGNNILNRNIKNIKITNMIMHQTFRI